MPKTINLPTFAQGLVQRFALKGRFQPVLDETIVPVVVVSSFEGSPGGVSAQQVSRSAAGGWTAQVGPPATNVGSSWWYTKLVNPENSGVGLNVSGLAIGISWANGKIYPLLGSGDEYDFYQFAGSVGPILTPTPNNTYTVISPITTKAFKDDRLRDIPHAFVTAGYATGSTAAAANFHEPTFGFGMLSDMMQGIGVGATSTNGQSQGGRVEEVNAILVAPGREVTIRSIKGWNGPQDQEGTFTQPYYSWSWEEIPLVAGTIR